MTSYHHGNLRSTLIETATELAATKGPDGVVLREVARLAGVSHNAAYRHFADREELLAEVAAIGLQRLAAAMRRRLAGVRATEPAARAVARLRATGRAYVEFALDEPGLFRVAFSTAPAPCEGADPYAVLLAALDDLVALGLLDAARRDGAAVTCWSAVHGFAELHLTGPLHDTSKRERTQQLELLLDTLREGLVPEAGDSSGWSPDVHP
ncbi:TetR/AcrR family transcriptional regulator [Pedococcus sp.]|uniref:TetR/AcrR family transcriptional regulator n=1 Tax=Pedococcus sp. TaxID=2860345 RepID=UPI0039C8EEDF